MLYITQTLLAFDYLYSLTKKISHGEQLLQHRITETGRSKKGKEACREGRDHRSRRSTGRGEREDDGGYDEEKEIFPIIDTKMTVVKKFVML